MDAPSPASAMPDPAASRIDASEAERTGRTRASVSLDQNTRAMLARATGGLSPAAMTVAAVDWWSHVVAAPALRMDLVADAAAKSAALATFAGASLINPDTAEPPLKPRPQDRRFAGEAWKAWPWSVMAQSFVMAEDWWVRAVSDAPGQQARHAEKNAFYVRQALDALCPANAPALNPEVLQATLRERGDNLRRGLSNWINDAATLSGARPGEAGAEFAVGETLACTPGEVVFRNHLIELIQYAPATDAVQAEPVLVVPAWIMKYYILDLSPHNSLIRWLVERGHTVFAISWRNPGPEDRDLGFDAYRRMGVEAAVNAALQAADAERLHAVGYCLGGTLLGVEAARMAREGDERLASLTFLAAQLDFAEAGELQLFIGESELVMLEALMDEKGYLDARQMTGAFQMLRPADLIWSRLTRDYLLGLERPQVDLLAWNADATRMPAAMHSEYLRGFYLENRFARGQHRVDGRAVAFSDVRAPVFAVGAVKDHIAPWRSVYRLHALADTEVTFALASGGHNGAIVAEPGKPGRSHQVATKADLDRWADPDAWAARAPHVEGSWWPTWEAWLRARASGAEVPARAPRRARLPGNALPDAGPLPAAPGAYVLQA